MAGTGQQDHNEIDDTAREQAAAMAKDDDAPQLANPAGTGWEPTPAPIFSGPGSPAWLAARAKRIADGQKEAAKDANAHDSQHSKEGKHHASYEHGGMPTLTDKHLANGGIGTPKKKTPTQIFEEKQEAKTCEAAVMDLMEWQNPKEGSRFAQSYIASQYMIEYRTRTKAKGKDDNQPNLADDDSNFAELDKDDDVPNYDEMSRKQQVAQAKQQEEAEKNAIKFRAAKIAFQLKHKFTCAANHYVWSDEDQVEHCDHCPPHHHSNAMARFCTIDDASNDWYLHNDNLAHAKYADSTGWNKKGPRTHEEDDDLD